MHKITPFLWFDGRLEEAVAFYTGVFKNARVEYVNARSAAFEIEGQAFLAFNGGPHFKFNEAVSFFIRCATQEEVDYFWTRLTEGGGAESRCGWLKDRFGVSWQVIPDTLTKYLADSDRAKADRVMQAMMTMRKIDIAALEAAYRG